MYERGHHRGIFGSYDAGDAFEVSVNAAGTVDYLVNGEVRYTSLSAPTFPLRVDMVFGDHTGDAASCIAGTTHVCV